MARYVGDVKEPTTIFEAAAYRKNVKVVCKPCGHAIVFDPHQLWWLFERRGWIGIFSEATKRFWCGRCRLRTGKKVRQVRIELTDDAPTITLDWPDERVWKGAINRHRG